MYRLRNPCTDPPGHLQAQGTRDHASGAGRNGTLAITEGDCVYDEFIASCECIAPNPASIPAFSAWLHGPGIVMFGNRPTGFYYARVNNQIDFETVVRGRLQRSSL